ncbi:hypothetical protein HY045_00830 [Candidatus Woesebacteria bacterium]|nr:hypothetical protein [Candidatus Woesebacteria bacterium]
MLKHKKLLILVLLLLGFVFRVILFDKNLRGDIAVIAEWGERLWVSPQKFYFDTPWYYAPPAYPPLSNLVFAGSFWLYKHNIFATIHNVFKIFPGSWVQYLGKPVELDPLLYTYGYYLLLKLPAILSDLIISLIVYVVVRDITKDGKKALLGLCVYLFNPVTIFLSGVWGQTESFIALFGFSAFILLCYKKAYLSIPLFFISIYLKPTWMSLLPFYLALIFYVKPKLTHLLIGLLLSASIYLFSTIPFSKGSVLNFTRRIYTEKIVSSSKGTSKASISAFNFYTVFFEIDKTFVSTGIGYLNIERLGILLYLLINAVVIRHLFESQENLLNKTLVGVFMVSFGTFIFLSSMLERYFSPGFISLIIIMITSPKILAKMIIVNTILFLNLFWAFYRRTSDEIGTIFTNYNYFLIRLLSAVMVILYLNFGSYFKIFTPDVLKFVGGKRSFRTFRSDF